MAIPIHIKISTSLIGSKKAYIINWFNENPSLEYITLNYHEKFTPNSKIHTKNNILGLQLLIEWLIDGLKTMGLIT